MSPARQAPQNPLAGAANLRGGILIAVAVLVGVVLLGKGFDSGLVGSSGGDPSDQSASGGDESTDGTSTDGGGTDASTTTTLPAHTPAEVRVQVLNSSGPSGSAGDASQRLSTAGYVALSATNADDRTAAATAVFFQPGYEQDAVLVAQQIGFAALVPQAMPAPPPPPAPVDANIVIVLGPDYVPGGTAAGTGATTTTVAAN